MQLNIILARATCKPQAPVNPSALISTNPIDSGHGASRVGQKYLRANSLSSSSTHWMRPSTP